MREGNQVRVVDRNRLLDGVAWERPFRQMLSQSFSTGFRDPIQAAVEITRQAERLGLPIAFTGWTAGAAYTSYARAFSVVQCYAKSSEGMESLFEGGNRVRVEVYLPDRDVFSGVALVNGTQLVAPSVCLLDLAGMGYSARDLTIALIEEYEGLLATNRNRVSH